MQIQAHLGVDVVALETDDQVDVLLELTAPAAATSDVTRPPAALQVVLDRSGSMDGGRLEAAKQALIALLDRLEPTDSFGIVVFDDVAEVVVPAGPLGDRASVKHRIAAIDAGGGTNLSGGYFRGLQEARRVCGTAGATLLLLSDGEANVGETDADTLGRAAGRAAQQGVTTVTVGIGLGYDEVLLRSLATGGAGDHAFAETGDDAAAVVAAQVSGLLSKTAQAASVLVRPDAAVAQVRVLNDIPAVALPDGVLLELGDLWAGERRRLVLRFAVPAMAALGLAEIATLELRYVRLPEVFEEIVTIPITVNVVPADVAAGRVANPLVHCESLLLEAQSAKKAALTALGGGDAVQAVELLSAAAERLAAESATHPELRAEAYLLEDMADRAVEDDVQRFTRSTTADIHSKSTRRGRTT